MNATLLRNRPEGMSEADFKAMWENSSHLFEAFYKTLLTYYPKDAISAKDFDSSNHYERLVWEGAQRDVLNKVIELLPKRLTTLS